MAAYEGGVEADYGFRSDTTPSATWDMIRDAALSNNFIVAKSYLNERMQWLDKAYASSSSFNALCR